MQIVYALPWAQVGESIQATVNCDFSLDLIWQVYIGGSIGGDYYDARSVDIDGQQLAAGVAVQVDFNQIQLNVSAGSFRTYSLAAHQRYLMLTASAGAPNKTLLTFYQRNRPEWR
jgi:hypothetical protein